MTDQDKPLSEWTRIPSPIENEQDRRTLVGILASVGLETRIVRIRSSKSAPYKRFVEYRVQE